MTYLLLGLALAVKDLSLLALGTGLFHSSERPATPKLNMGQPMTLTQRLGIISLVNLLIQMVQQPILFALLSQWEVV